MDLSKLQYFSRGRIQAVFLAMGLYALLYAGLQDLYKPRGRPAQFTFAEAKRVPIVGQQEAIPFYRLLTVPETTCVASTSIYQEGDVLVLPRVSGNRLTVSVNDYEVYLGGGRSGTGNIWTAFHWVDLPLKAAGRSAHIQICIYGTYDVGIREIPYFLRAEDSQGLRWFTALVCGHLYWVVIGIILVLAALQLFYSSIDPNLRRAYLLNVFGMLLGAVYLLEFAWRDDSGSVNSYLWVRKILLVSGYLAPWFMLCAMEFYTKKKLRTAYYAAPLTLLSLGFVLFADSLPQLKQWTVYGGALAQFNWLFLLIIAVQTRHNRIVFAVAFFYLTLIGGLAALITPKTHIFMLQFGYMFAMASLAYNMMEEFARLHEDFRAAYKKSLMDPLTGAYNRFIFDEISVSDGDLVILVDMNNFKSINDDYGHEAGDRVLVEWVKSAKAHIREGDIVARTGGDEFVILLRGAKEANMDKMLADFQTRLDGLPASFAYGMEIVQGSLKDAMRKADERMFEQKEKGRGNWLGRLLH